MKKILIYIFLTTLLFSIFYTESFAESCPYQGKIDQCEAALRALAGKELRVVQKGERIKSVSNFPCIQHDAEMRVMQIIMDEKFSEIDVEMEAFLADFYEAKDFYFGTTSDFDVLDALGQIESLGDAYYKKFSAACDETVQESASCLGATTISSATDFVSGNESGACYELARKKVAIFKQVAYNGLMLNSAELELNAKKTYNQIQRTKYNEVLDLMMLHLSYVERLWKKTSSLTTNVY